MKRIIGTTAILLAALILLGVALRAGLWVMVYDWIVGHMIRTFDLNPFLAKGLAWFGVAVISLVPLRTLLRRSRRINFIVFALVGAATLGGWYVHRDDLFTPQGQPVRYVAITNSGLVLSQRPGVDPGTGATFEPVTKETAPVVTLWLKTGGLPPLQDQPCAPAFNALSGQALCWFELTSDGVLFSRLPGYSPVDGQRLQPVTHAIIEGWQRRQAFRQKRDALLSSPAVDSFRVTLTSTALTNNVTTTSVSTGSDGLPAGTKIAVSIKFYPLGPESLGLDRLTPASIAVHKAIGLWPGQTLLFRLSQSVDGAHGSSIISAGSTAEAVIGVNTAPNDANQLLVTISVIGLFLPKRRVAIPMSAHLDPSCTTPLMNLQTCDLILDEPFSDTARPGTDSPVRASIPGSL